MDNTIYIVVLNKENSNKKIYKVVTQDIYSIMATIAVCDKNFTTNINKALFIASKEAKKNNSKIEVFYSEKNAEFVKNTTEESASENKGE